MDGLRGRVIGSRSRLVEFAREDQTRILRATLLNRAITVYGFSPQIAFSNQLRESNAQLFDFKRNLVEMRWVRQFLDSLLSSPTIHQHGHSELVLSEAKHLMPPVLSTP